MSAARRTTQCLSVVLPGVAVALAAVVIAGHLEAAAPAATPMLPWAAPALLALAFVLSLLFHRSRLSTVAIVLAAMAACHHTAPPGGQAFALTALIVSASALTAALQPDLRTLSVGALLRVLLGLVLAGFVTLADAPTLAPLAERLGRPIPALLPWTALPAAAIALAAALAVLLPTSRRWRTQALLLQTTALALAALELGQRPAPAGAPGAPWAAFIAFSAGAGFMLVWTVLDAAWQNAFMDELTGLPGRRPMEHDLSGLGRRYALAMVDVDHFKRINDRYGHDTGDQVLRFVAAQLASVRGGRAYRYGGEEFVIVLPRGDPKRQAETLDALRARIASRRFVVRSLDRPARKPRSKKGGSADGRGIIRVTVSVGMAARADGQRRPSDVLDAADKALYRAKRTGRNRLCVA